MEGTDWGDGLRETHICVLCGARITGMGNNPEPLATYQQRCCNDCNNTRVIPERIRRMEHVTRLHLKGEED